MRIVSTTGSSIACEGVNRFTTIRDKYAGVPYISDHYPIEIVLKF